MPYHSPIWITALALDILCPGPSRIAARRFSIKLDDQEVANLPKPLAVVPIHPYSVRPAGRWPGGLVARPILRSDPKWHAHLL